ncbi:MAG TPA: hypothetical protein VKP60_11185 [Magnetospirillaceae bacterium]|nr:hypothetical protein [Magnetospirillaceae bacterium]
MRAILLSAALLLVPVASFADGEMPSIAGKVTVPANLPPTVIPLTIDSDQIMFEAQADGPKASRKLLVIFNMGHGFSGWQSHVYEEAGFVRHTPVNFHIGPVPFEVAAGMSAMFDDGAYPDRQLLTFFSTHKVEGMIEPGVLQNFDIALDYSQKTLTMAAAGTLPHDGVAVPLRVKEETNVVAVDVMVDGKPYPMVIDAGAPYTWIRPATAAEWLKGHPERAHGKGAVGEANFWMMDTPAEQEGTLIRVPEAQIGSMKIANFGVLGTDPRLAGVFGMDSTEAMFDDWQKNNTPGGEVAFLGANILKHYRITIDYKAHMSWWKKIDEIDPHELDQVGLSFLYDKGVYSVGRVATKDGEPTVKGVEKGDKIVAVDDASAKGWSRGQLYAALGGKPGGLHKVTVARAGKTLTLSLPVTAF